MPMMTGQQYEDSLRKLNFNVYMFGEKVDNLVDNPIIRPSMEAVKLTYELAHDPQYEDLMTATSHLSGKKVNRFTHIHQSTEDFGQEDQDGPPAGFADRLLLPALRGNGRP